MLLSPAMYENSGYLLYQFLMKKNNKITSKTVVPIVHESIGYPYHN